MTRHANRALNPPTPNPEFNIDTDGSFLVVLGHSEGKRVGKLLASTLGDMLPSARDIEVVRLNQMDGLFTKKKYRDLAKASSVISHSAGVMYVPEAKQIVAINPPEQVAASDLIYRALFKIVNDPVTKEEGCHSTGLVDMMGAGIEQALNPITTAKTIARIHRGFSAVNELSARQGDFPGGRGIIHVERDSFEFNELADMYRARENGVATIMVPGKQHNDVLFSPEGTLSCAVPHIFPDLEAAA